MSRVEKCPYCDSDQIGSRWDAPRARLIEVCENCGKALLPETLPNAAEMQCEECGWRASHAPKCSRKRLRTPSKR